MVPFWQNVKVNVVQLRCSGDWDRWTSV